MTKNIQEWEKEFDNYTVIHMPPDFPLELAEKMDEELKSFISSLLLSQRKEIREIVVEKVKEARSDTAPFSREPIEHANNLIQQKNKIFDDILNNPLLREEIK